MAQWSIYLLIKSKSAGAVLEGSEKETWHFHSYLLNVTLIIPVECYSDHTCGM